LRRSPRLLPVLLVTPLLAACAGTAAPEFALAIHGGAGTMSRDQMTPEMEAGYRDALESALLTGYAVLEAGGSATDAVVAAIRPLEESPLFNAGVGAVFTHDGTVEHDASIMDGRDQDAGAVSGVGTVRSPIRLARTVMDVSPHVMLSGPGAESFAAQQGLEIVPNETFHTERRLEQLRRAQSELASAARFGAGLDPASVGGRLDGHGSRVGEGEPEPFKFGTVGCVALDRDGHLAAGTSTGGMTNKRFGRIGDSPIIGAGTYANDATCAVSATGHGEYFIRAAVAHSVSDRMRLAGEDIDTAAKTVIFREMGGLGGTGGVIAIDGMGRVSAPFNTEGMYRGWVRAGEAPTVRIYADEDVE